jgi:hypothetical protein
MIVDLVVAVEDVVVDVVQVASIAIEITLAMMVVNKDQSVVDSVDVDGVEAASIVLIAIETTITLVTMKTVVISVAIVMKMKKMLATKNREKFTSRRRPLKMRMKCLQAEYPLASILINLRMLTLI